MNAIGRLACFLATGFIVALGVTDAQAESKHVFGIHNWEWGADLDVMSGLTGWVTSPVGFAAFAETSMGENIFAVGGHEVLGSWGQSGHGVPLTTTAETYPAWASEATVDVPLGTRLEWKLPARKGDEVRWEGGDNRVGLASPAVCSASALLTGSWR